tara:strand:+ start:1374 stop:2408 length:1035 start_codon:yes stop_codon:yes gene_type:complete
MNDSKKKVLVTGAAGFVGSQLSKKLIENNFKVIGFDNLNNYYDVNLKKARLDDIKVFSEIYKNKWNFIFGELCDKDKVHEIFKKYSPEIVIHLAAQAGVRYSIKDPSSYVNSNLVGFVNILEASRINKIEHLIYASSSSVYGGNEKIPYSEIDQVNHPISLYAATKKSNELIAHSYSHLFNLPCTGLRLFTVYGPWGRPDMAPMIFTKSILERKVIKIFNNGEMWRDFTYINDVVNAVMGIIKKPPIKNLSFNKKNPDPSKSWAPYMIFNIGNSNSIKLTKFISILEHELGVKAIKVFENLQPGDVISTKADTKSIEQWIGYKSKTPLEVGIKFFVKWYRDFYI